MAVMRHNCYYNDLNDIVGTFCIGGIKVRAHPRTPEYIE